MTIDVELAEGHKDLYEVCRGINGRTTWAVYITRDEIDELRKALDDVLRAPLECWHMKVPATGDTYGVAAYDFTGAVEILVARLHSDGVEDVRIGDTDFVGLCEWDPGTTINYGPVA